MTNFIFHIRKISIHLLAFMAFILLFSQEILAQCVMCSGQLEAHGDNGTSTAVNTGILYLLIMPFLFMGFIGFMFYKRNQKMKEEGEDEQISGFVD